MPRGAALLPAGALLSILIGLALRLTGSAGAAAVVWSAGLAVTGLAFPPTSPGNRVASRSTEDAVKA